MMGFTKKDVKWFALLGVLAVLYLAIRIYHLTALPIFTDEAIYIRWSQIAKQDANWRFISLTDGKQPMFVWVAMFFLKIFKDPLMAGRMVSVASGLGSMVGLYFAGREIFKSSKVGIVTSLLYLVFPYAMVYNRMALYETMVGLFVIWSLYLTFLLVRTVRLDIALILGMVVGGGMLTKTSAFFNLPLLFVTAFAFDFKDKAWKEKLGIFIWYSVIVSGLAIMFYSILRLSPFFHIISDKNAIFVYPLHEWLQHPTYFLLSNLSGLWDWFWKYTTPPWVALIPVAFFIDKKFFREKAVLVMWFLMPFVYLTIFGRTLYPRFVFPMAVSLLPLVAYGLIGLKEKMKNKVLTYIVFALFFVVPLWMDYFMLNDFAHAPIPLPDLRQFILDWPAGGGVQDSVQFFQAQAAKGPIYIGTEGTFGLMPFAYEIYLVNNPNVKIVGYWPMVDNTPQTLLDESKKEPTYMVFYQPCVQCQTVGMAPATWQHLKLISSINRAPKYAEPRYLTVYQVIPK